MQEALLLLFFVGMCGDAYTTFIGILAALGTELGDLAHSSHYIFATIGTSVITGLSFITVDVFERKEKIISIIWLPAVIIDLIASLYGSFGLIKSTENTYLSYFLIFFITLFITCSPALLRYFSKKPIL